MRWTCKADAACNTPRSAGDSVTVLDWLNAVRTPATLAWYKAAPSEMIDHLLGEVMHIDHRALDAGIAADGQPQKAELKQSSGFERLDQAALTTVMKWRYVPGKRGGVAEDMWFNVPINFVLE